MTINVAPFTVRILEVDKPNLNGRVYPRATVEDIIRQCEKQKGRVFGTIGMPEGTSLELASISHSVNNLRITDDGWLIGDVMLLDTPCGHTLQTLINDGMKYDYRTAGIGNIDENGVVSNYRVVSISAVLDGA